MQPNRRNAPIIFLVLFLGFMTPDLNRLRGGSVQVEAIDADDPDSPNRSVFDCIMIFLLMFASAHGFYVF